MNFLRNRAFDLDVEAKGDVEVDLHHTVEDVGITLGRALSEAIKEKTGIRRFGFSCIPMDESLSLFSIDLSGRPYLVFNVQTKGRAGGLGAEVVKEFSKGFSNEARCAVHVNVLYGENTHHIIEAIFKAFGVALREAVKEEEKRGFPSTEGVL